MMYWQYSTAIRIARAEKAKSHGLGRAWEVGKTVEISGEWECGEISDLTDVASHMVMCTWLSLTPRTLYIP